MKMIKNIITALILVIAFSLLLWWGQSTQQNININEQQNNMPATVAGTNQPMNELKITTLEQGSGPLVKAGDKLTVEYEGRLTDGTVFDSSSSHGQPFSFTVGVGQVIKGWDQGLIGMQVGERRQLEIPADLAYGERGAGDTIPPYADLIFEVKLQAIE